MKVVPVDRPEVPPLVMSPRFRTEVVFFTTPPGERGAPTDLGPSEYWVDQEKARRCLDEFVVQVVSPLDAASKAEIALSEEHEIWLEWMLAHGIQRIRLE
jgi:hypothetical protein